MRSMGVGRQIVNRPLRLSLLDRPRHLSVNLTSASLLSRQHAFNSDLELLVAAGAISIPSLLHSSLWFSEAWLATLLYPPKVSERLETKNAPSSGNETLSLTFLGWGFPTSAQISFHLIHLFTCVFRDSDISDAS